MMMRALQPPYATVPCQTRRQGRGIGKRSTGKQAAKNWSGAELARAYDPSFGARPLKRAIQRLLQNPLALSVLEGGYAEGDVVRVDRPPSGNALVFSKAAAGLARAVAPG